MAKKETKPVSDATLVTSLDTQRILLVDPSGSVQQITPENLRASVLDGVNLDAIFDNVFILYHAADGDYPRFVKPFKWPSLQSGGEVASGIMIIEGGKALVVSPTEATGLYWSSAAISGGGVTTSDITTAIMDWQGKANTASQVAASKADAITNTASYAPGFCNLYTRPNGNGNGLTAGKWWLPSAGELSMIYANMLKINYAGSFIAGFEPLAEAAYWSSTEYSAANAWNLLFNSGSLFRGTKSTLARRVRPVSALQL
ncbi:MAG: DUF1566 domain-containing protein [Proteiniphilum sp.]